MNLNDIMADESVRRGLTDVPKVTPTPASDTVSVAGGDGQQGRAWATAALRGRAEDLAAMAPNSGRNAALNAAAYKLGRLTPRWLSADEITSALLEACRHNGLLAEDGLKACRATLQSGLSAGMQDPRDPPRQLTPVRAGGAVAAAGLGPTGKFTAVCLDEGTGPVADPVEPDQPSPHQDAEHDARVLQALLTLRATYDARQLHAAELAVRTFRVPSYTRSLTEELALPDEPASYAVDELLPAGGNALLAAGFKAGKTTLLTNLVRAYADGVPFLGRYPVTPGVGRIAVFNYELSPGQYRRWLRETGIVNTDRIAVLHLRGHRLPLSASDVEDWIVGWLRDQDVSFWIVDPFARAAAGIEENSNTEVGAWLETFDVIKERAGISEAVLATHTGRAVREPGEERARGASRLDDWADARWLLVRDHEARRFFRAAGRDVDIAEQQLSYDPGSRLLTLGGGDRRWSHGHEVEQRVLDYVNAHPGAGVKQIQDGVSGNKDQIDKARRALVDREVIRTEDGPRKAQLHFAKDTTARPSPSVPNGPQGAEGTVPRPL